MILFNAVYAYDSDIGNSINDGLAHEPDDEILMENLQENNDKSFELDENSKSASNTFNLKNGDNSDFESIETLINSSNTGDSIHLENKTYYGNGTPITINKNITIYGFAPDLDLNEFTGNEIDLSKFHTILDAQGKSNIFIINEDISVNLIGLTLINGNVSADGGSIYNNGYLTLTNSSIINTVSEGGAIYNSKNTRLTVKNSLFDKNEGICGGAIFSEMNTDVKITDSTIQNSYCSSDGGAIYTRSNLTICNSTLNKNNGTRGGVIYNNHGIVKIYNSTMSSNFASQMGGTVKNWGTCEIHNTSISDNFVDGLGGGLYTFELSMKLVNCTINNNSARNGGGIFSDANSKLIVIKYIYKFRKIFL